MRYCFLFFALFLFGKVPAEALSLTEVDYTSADSAQVVRWLEEADKADRNTNWMLYFAKKFQGLPYVGGTLDRNREERLVVNLKELDCTTFVENVTALSLTAKRGSTSFYDFCEALEKIRYAQGMRTGYASRNHYFSEWIRSNQDQGLLRDLFEEKKMQSPAPMQLEPLTVKLNYMSRNADKYPMLKGDKEALKLIAEKEKEMNGQKVWYLPKTKMKSGMKELEWLQDGDIVAFVTKKAGLDIAHVGIVCRVNGALRFLHASSLRKKVVLEPLSLISYVQKQPMQTGIRIVRIY